MADGNIKGISANFAEKLKWLKIGETQAQEQITQAYKRFEDALSAIEADSVQYKQVIDAFNSCDRTMKDVKSFVEMGMNKMLDMIVKMNNKIDGKK